MSAEAWASARKTLADYVVARLVNRTDAHGRYAADGSQYTAKGCLTRDDLERHFAATGPADIIGLHTTRAEEIEGPDGEALTQCTSKTSANDIDHHGDGPEPPTNFKAALAWCARARDHGFRPMLADTNGRGGYRVWINFSEPVKTALSHHLMRWLQRDWADFGFEKEPEVFPKQASIALDGFGNWVRLFGRHHKRDHWTRFWDGERWLEGQEAVDYLLDHTGDDPALIPAEVHELAKADAGRKAASGGEDKDFSDLLVATEALGNLKHLADDYDQWIMIGQCLTALGNAGLGLWDTWSKTAKSGTYVEGECGDKWKTFKAPSEMKGRAGRNLGTLLKLAEEQGFKGHKSASASPRDGKRPVATEAGWEPITKGKDGAWVSCVSNSRLWLESRGKVIRYDTFRQDVHIDGGKLNDRAVIALTNELERDLASAWCQEHIRSAVIDIAHDHSFSSLADWLTGLKWDGVYRADWFFTHAFGCEDTQYHRACGKVCLLSAAARALRPGCQADVTVVLTGRQGVGKSTGMAALCPKAEWYADDLGCDLFAAKAGEGLRGKWIVEFSEFARINKATMDVVKAFLTRRSDYYRPAYARTHEDFPRACIFYGTSNEECPLTEEENRRFMPIAVKQADFKWIAENRDQLWAESVARVRGGDKWWVTDHTLMADVVRHQESARQTDAWETILGRKLRRGVAITMEDAAEALEIHVDRLDRATQTRIGKCLKMIGYTKTRVRDDGVRIHHWSKP